jgi:L-fuconolactonase
MIIDAHQHFWRLSRGDYDWLTPAAGVLYRDYLPEDLAPILEKNAVSATVLVQAAPTEAETYFLFELSQAHSFIAGIVGWTDFESADAPQRIAALAAAGRGKLKGLRPMIQDIPDPAWVTRPALDAVFEAMTAHELVFDALVRPAHLGALRERLLRHTKLGAVLDHAGKPDIAGGDLDTWARELERLARDTAVCCKLSGLLSEAGEGASQSDLAPCVAHVFECFGAERVLWGSDWPVLKGISRYASWLEISLGLIERFAPGCAEQVFAGTARRLYRLALP